MTCELRIIAAPEDESLARIVGLLRRTRWSIRELHHRRVDDRQEIEVRVSKVAGRPDVLLSQVRREIVVVEAMPLPR